MILGHLLIAFCRLRHLFVLCIVWYSILLLQSPIWHSTTIGTEAVLCTAACILNAAIKTCHCFAILFSCGRVYFFFFFFGADVLSKWRLATVKWMPYRAVTSVPFSFTVNIQEMTHRYCSHNWDCGQKCNTERSCCVVRWRPDMRTKLKRPAVFHLGRVRG